MTDGSGYVLETLREGAEFPLYRGRQDGNPLPVLAVALTAEQPSPQSLRQLEPAPGQIAWRSFGTGCRCAGGLGTVSQWSVARDPRRISAEHLSKRE
jgi:hypothetical protein